MYTKQQIARGAVAYLLQEMANNNCQDGRKWLIPFAGEPYIIKYLGQMDDLLKELNYMTEDGMIDVDSVYNSMVRIAEEQGKIKVDLPLIKGMTLGQEDVMRIYNCIKMIH